MDSVKQHGRVYTPAYIVEEMLNFGNYCGENILLRHVIDNSCGDGAFLVQIVQRYCQEFLKQSSDLQRLSTELSAYIHGIEIDPEETCFCIRNLDSCAERFGLSSISWDIICANTLEVDRFDNQMDFVFGNPPYVRIHNLETCYEQVKRLSFSKNGMTDLYIVFYEIGLKMLRKNGKMCLITPSSWLSSNAGSVLRRYITEKQNLSKVIDLGHFQPFEATTYTIISLFTNSKQNNTIEYFSYDEKAKKPFFEEILNYSDFCINDKFYLGKKVKLEELKSIIEANFKSPKVQVKNGFATLADKIFIDNFPFEGCIDILKASTGKWSKAIFPYTLDGKPLKWENIEKNASISEHLLSYKKELSNRSLERDGQWYLYGRTQAIKDICKDKIAINTMVKDKSSLKINLVPAGKGLYSGLYILTEVSFDDVYTLLYSDEFIEYISLLKNYKSGGYYCFSSKDVEKYLNYKLSADSMIYYEQSRASQTSFAFV